MTTQQFPEPTVGALILNPENKALLVKSHKWMGKYVLPGGHVELGESLMDALKREMKEETGLEIYDCEFIGLQEIIFDNAFWKRKHLLVIDYACRTDSSEVSLNYEGQQYVWVSVQEALQLPIGPYTRRTLEDYAKRQMLDLDSRTYPKRDGS